MGKRNGLKILVLALLSLGLYARVLWGLVEDWWIDANYSHGFLIPVVCGRLVWERREHLTRLPFKPVDAGLALVFIAIFLLIAGTLGSELFLQRVSLILLLTGMILYLAGVAH